MEGIEKNNQIIESIIKDIDNLLIEKNELNEQFIGTAIKMFGAELVKKFIRYGGLDSLKDLVTTKVTSMGDDIKSDVSDLVDKVSLDIDKTGKPSGENLDDIVADMEATRERIRQKLKSREVYTSDGVTEYETQYNTIKIKFKDDFKLEVNADIGKKYEKKYSYNETQSFDVVTTKKTNVGYILNLKNDNLGRDVSLLIYTDSFRTDRQIRVSVQLTYKNGTYNGNRISGDIDIIRLD